MSSPNRATRNNNVSAGLFGAGGGTALVILINSYVSPTNQIHALLIWAAPSLSVIISGLWLKLKRWIDARSDDYALNRELTRAKAAALEIENDPKASARAKADARKRLDGMQSLKMTLHDRRAQAILERSQFD